jgi:hypothetical protein
VCVLAHGSRSARVADLRAAGFLKTVRSYCRCDLNGGFHGVLWPLWSTLDVNFGSKAVRREQRHSTVAPASLFR